ncbi:MAG: PAS domain S-box protein [Nitrospirae bacterium]|nr:PAS domain S-box protein [Nitrospirota bacterium]
MQKYISLIRWKIILISIGLGILFWIIDSFVDVLIFNDGTVVSHLFTPGPYEIYVRLLTSGLLILFGIIAQHLIIKYRRTEDEVNKILRQQEAILDNIPDIAWLKDKESRFIAVNGPFGKACGFKPEDLAGKNDLDIWPLDLAEKYRADDREVMASGKRKSVEEPLADKEGKVSWIETIKTPIYNEKVEIIGTTGIARDITKRKKAEEALKESESRYRNLFENAHDMIQSIAPDGHIRFVNPSWLKTMGYTLEELQHLKVFDILHPDYKGHCMKTLEKVIAGESLNNVKAAFIAKNGRLVHVEGNASVLELNGKVVACNGIFRDVTERYKMEEQVFQIKHDWEDTFNIITDMITVHDEDFNIIRYNKAAEKMLGLPLLTTSREKCYQYYHGTDCPPAGCPSCQTLKTGEASTVEMFEPHLNMHIEIRAIPRFDSEHHMVGLIHVVRDITERKRLEDQLRHAQKMEAIGTLTGGIAHDFNNILTAIIGYASLCRMKMDKDDPLRIHLDQILSSSERAANLIQSLLAFSRKHVTYPEPLNICEAIKSIEKLLQGVIGDKITLKMVLAGSLTVMADRVQMDQVLINLCANARDAMPDGGTLTIKTEAAELDSEFAAMHGYGEQGKHAVISVSDTGTGMDEKTMERIFEPFFTTKEVGKGTGLGLSIVYGIIKQNKGNITCYSEPGRGTTFRIYLPLVKGEVRGIEKSEIPDLANVTETVLLAEDESEVRKLTSLILEGAGYKVIEAVDGEDAVNRFLENKDIINLLLFDVIMPKMNGKEAYDRIKDIKPDIKILFTSGYPLEFISDQGIYGDKLSFISKPVSPTVLLKEVRKTLNK